LIWRLSLSLVEVDRWKQAHKHAQKTHKKNTRERKKFLFWTSGKDYGSFSLLLPCRPGLVEDRRSRQDKKTRRFSGRTFWTSIFHTQPKRTCVLLFYLVFFLFDFPVALPQLDYSAGYGALGPGAMVHLLSFFLSFVSLPRVRKDLAWIANRRNYITNLPDWKPGG